MLASVVVGMPMEPNMVGTPLAKRQASIERSGSKPRARSMEVGMATASAATRAPWASMRSTQGASTS